MLNSFAKPVPVLTVTETNAQLQTPQAPYLLDVRQPEEYHEGHIAGSVLIPLGELTEQVSQLPRDRAILCICRSGSRSHMAAQYLIQAGYQAINLQGGMLAWAAAKLPIEVGLT